MGNILTRWNVEFGTNGHILGGTAIVRAATVQEALKRFEQQFGDLEIVSVREDV